MTEQDPPKLRDRHTLYLFTKLVGEGMIVIVITHNPETASYVKRIIKVRDGKILEDLAIGKVL